MPKSLEIVVRGRIPSKKNAKRIARGKNGKPFILSSKNHQAWHEEQSWLLKGQLQDNYLELPIQKCIATINLYAPDKRKSDLTNKVESIMDLLVDNGFIEDDNWFCVQSLIIHFMGVDRKDPRAIIILSLLEDDQIQK